MCSVNGIRWQCMSSHEAEDSGHPMELWENVSHVTNTNSAMSCKTLYFNKINLIRKALLVSIANVVFIPYVQKKNQN